MYIAVSYIGTEFTPGEVLPDGLDEAFVKRLLKSGAIREAAPDPTIPAATNTDDMTDEEKLEMTRQNYYAQLRALGYSPDGNPLTPDDQQDAEGDIEDSLEDEDLEPGAPEVDAAAALVQETAEEEKPAPVARKGGKRK